MEMVIKLPSDLRSLPTFRALKAALGEARAMLCWFIVFQELNYRTEEGGPAGRIGRQELPALLGDAAGVLELAGDALQKLVLDAGLFKVDGDDLICPRFMALHGGPRLGPRGAASLGGDMRALAINLRKLDEGEAKQLALGIADEKWLDGDGKPLDPESRRRVTRLIVGLDGALRKGTRPLMHFSEGLIADALRIVRETTDVEVDLILKKVVRYRDNPMLQTTTEKLLPELKQKLAALGS